MGIAKGRAEVERGSDVVSATRDGHRPIRVLLIDDDEDDFLLTRDLISELGGRYSLDWIASYEGGLEAICNVTGQKAASMPTKVSWRMNQRL